MKFVVMGTFGGVPADDLVLREVEVEQRVGPEPVVVEHVRRVVERRRAPRGQDVVPGGVALAPEGRAPGLVEPVERGVAPLEPLAEGDRAVVAVAGQVVAGVLVRDVPHRQARGGRGSARRARSVRARAISRKSGDDGHHDCRLPGHRVCPSRSTGRISGYAEESQGGGVAVAVARSTAMPFSWSRSMTSSSHSKVYSPLVGSSQDHEKTPERDEADAGLSHEAHVVVPDVREATARGCSRHRRRPGRWARHACEPVCSPRRWRVNTFEHKCTAVGRRGVCRVSDRCGTNLRVR